MLFNICSGFFAFYFSHLHTVMESAYCQAGFVLLAGWFFTGKAARRRKLQDKQDGKTVFADR